MTMIYVGSTRQKSIVERIRSFGWGRIWTDRSPTINNTLPGEYWAFDNNAYAYHKRDELFNWREYLKKIKRVIYNLGEDYDPQFCVCPDVVGNWQNTVELLDPVFEDRIMDIGTYWMWYFVIQDDMPISMAKEIVEKHHYIQGFFLGGTDKLKKEAGKWADLSRDLGVKLRSSKAP